MKIRNKLEKWIALLTCFVLLLGMMPVSALAAGTGDAVPVDPVTVTYINPLYADEMTEADLNQPGAGQSAVALADVDEYYTSVQEVGEAVREQLKARTETIVVGIQADNKDPQQMYDIMHIAMEHTGVPTEGDYLRWQYGGWQCLRRGYESEGVYYLTMTYTVTYYTTAAQETELDTTISELLNKMNLSGKTDYEKIKGIYDYICDNVTYDYDNLGDSDYKLKYTAYAALVNKTAVCQGYALLLYRLALELGVDCRFISGTGNGGAHGWNIIGLDGLYYNADATWDAGYSRYIYFLTSDANFNNHIRNDEYATEEFYAAYPMGRKNYDPNAGESVVASGTCGENLTWALDGEGTLTISGTGAMESYISSGAAPWMDYKSQITSVVMEEGVTSIGSYAFYGMSDLTGITIPEGVITIGAYAFKNCTALDNVVLPGTLTKIGESAFFGCTGLSAIDIPEGIYTIWSYTFKNCTSLAEVTLPSTLIKIDEAAFYGCSALDELEIPDNVAIIGVYCLKNCTNLTSVRLPAKLTEVREAAFYGTALTNLEIPNGVTMIGPYAFKNCTGLTAISLPETLTTIGESAFYGSAVANLVIPDAVTSIGSYAFKNCVKLANVQLPAGLTAVSEASFYNCSSLTALVIPDNVTAIGNYAFRNCTGLTSVTFGSGLKVIGESSFYGSSRLTTLVIPEGVTSIGAYAFKSCTSLTSVSLPNTLSAIKESAFYGCTGLTEIEIPENVTSMEAYAFSRCTGLETITFTGDAPSIGNSAFAKVAATVYYPAANVTWTSSVMQNYGGTLTWTEV